VFLRLLVDFLTVFETSRFVELRGCCPHVHFRWLEGSVLPRTMDMYTHFGSRCGGVEVGYRGCDVFRVFAYFANEWSNDRLSRHVRFPGGLSAFGRRMGIS
jgi:hypothetical protein